MEGNLKSKMVVLLFAACWATAVAGQVLECQSDDQCKYGVGYYCDHANKCRKCLSCEELNRAPSPSRKACITSVVDCGDCLEGLTEDLQGLQCVGTVLPVYVWVLIALGGLLLFAIIVAYVLRRNTETVCRVFASARTSLQPGCNGTTATAPELPPPYNTLYSPVRAESPAAPPLPPHFIDEEAGRPFIKYPPPPVPACESAGNQEANVYNNPTYVRGPHLPNNYHTAEREPEPEYLHDETTAESPWRPGDTANNTAGENSSSDTGSSSGVGTSASGGGGGGGGGGEGGGAAPLSSQLATARNTTLLRPPCQDATPNKMPRLRQDSNNNRNNRDRDDEVTMPRPSAGGGATFNILVNVQQLNDVKL